MSEMRRLHVGMPDGTGYEVRIGPGALDRVGDYLDQQGIEAGSQLVLVSDANVAPLYGVALRDALEEAGYAVMDLVVPAGEKSKSLACASELWSALAERGIERDATVLALGGGVVGDLSGFVASTYLRGIRYVQIPTSLLAMVDSSVGGKTAVDLPQGKNLVGTFKQPAYVLADIDTLQSLPEGEWKNGLGEAAKSALVGGGDFYRWLTSGAAAVRAHEKSAVRDLVVRCVTFKAGVVARDETEVSGERECLNYGHTLAHAIEVEAGYGTFGHGVAVAEGMRFASRLAVEAAGAPKELVALQDSLLDSLGLPPLAWHADPKALLDRMKHDKKARAGQVRMVLLTGVGSWRVQAVSDEVLLRHLTAWARSKGALR